MCKDKIDVLSKEDITDEELEQYHIPFNNNLNDYMIKYVIPEVISFQLANSYYRGCLCNSSFEQHFKGMRDVFNVFPELDDVKSPIVDLLKVKYNLVITTEEPLSLEKWQ